MSAIFKLAAKTRYKKWEFLRSAVDKFMVRGKKGEREREE
jgi:hypothetical protein